MFSPFTLPEGVFLLITDQLASPADFVITQSIFTHLKKGKGKIVHVSSSKAWEGRLQILGGKSGINLLQHKTSGSFHSIDIDNENENPSLRSIYDKLVGLNLDAKTTVIVDDISSLEWTGQYETKDITRFCRAVAALCSRTSATLLLRHHIVDPTDPDSLLRQLHQLCTYHMEVIPLASGRSGAVSGEVALHLGPSTSRTDTAKLLPRTSAMQYRLTDYGVVFFERGSSSGVL